jgi:hypothetical protein
MTLPIADRKQGFESNLTCIDQITVPRHSPIHTHRSTKSKHRITTIGHAYTP